jgi:hypothetical protein
MRRHIIVLLAGVLAACQSSQPPAPCEPEIIPKPYPVPVFVGVWIPELPPIEFPAYPPAPNTGAPEEEWKEYALEVREVAKERTALRDARIRAQELQIEANNAFALEHPAPDPEPPPIE